MGSGAGIPLVGTGSSERIPKAIRSTCKVRRARRARGSCTAGAHSGRCPSGHLAGGVVSIVRSDLLAPLRKQLPQPMTKPGARLLRLGEPCPKTVFVDCLGFSRRCTSTIGRRIGRRRATRFTGITSYSSGCIRGWWRRSTDLRRRWFSNTGLMPWVWIECMHSSVSGRHGGSSSLTSCGGH